MSSRIKLSSDFELGGGARLGGCFAGPKGGTTALWKGRPPILGPEGPKVLSIAMRTLGPIGAGNRSIQIHAEVGNAFGDIITRDFVVGEGLSADIRVGAFQHSEVRTSTEIPDGSTLYFSWAEELPASQSDLRLINYLSYPFAGVRASAPEGSQFVTAESACQITWTVDLFGTTFVQGVGAGAIIPVNWGSFSCNVPNKFIFHLRGF